MGFFLISCGELRSNLIMKHQELSNRILATIASSVKGLANVTTTRFEKIATRLRTVPSGIEELAELEEFKSTVPTKVKELKSVINQLTTYFDVLNAMQYEAKEEFTLKWRVIGWPNKTEELTNACNEVISEKKEEFSAQMMDEQAVFMQDVDALEVEVQSFASYTDISRVEV